MKDRSRTTRAVTATTLPHAHCRYCEQEIVELADIGWLDPTPGDTYDLCPGSPYGDHEPSDAKAVASDFAALYRNMR